MQINKPKKVMIFVSTGRCGTVRLTEILKKTLKNNFTVSHQTTISRIANILGNFAFLLNLKTEFIKNSIFKKLLKSVNTENFIITDPLVSMVIPDKLINSENVCIIHIYRESKDFAKSFYKFTRLKKKSFIAHNFIPFWQINVLPLQNWILGEKITKKYERTAEIKNTWFKNNYKNNKYFESTDMQTVYNSNFTEKKVNAFFGVNLNLNTDDLKIKSNTSDKK